MNFDNLDVKVTIKLSEVIGSVGSWYPCIYIVNSELEADAYDEYTKLSELADTTSEKTTYETTSDVYKAASLMFMQDNAPSKIAVLAQSAFSAVTFEKYKNKGFRQVVLVGTHDNVKTIAEYIESTDKLMLFALVKNATELNTLYTDIKTYDRTVVICHKDEYANAAVVGATSGMAAGSFTYKNIKIKGIEPEELTSGELDMIHVRGGMAIVEKAGDVVTSEGKTASGEYIDIIDSMDYVIQNIAYKTQKVFNNNKKVAYTNNGIALLEAATLEVLKEAVSNEMIATDDDGQFIYSTDFIGRSETTAKDRTDRNYPYGKFYFELAGAVHNATISGEISE